MSPRSTLAFTLGKSDKMGIPTASDGAFLITVGSMRGSGKMEYRTDTEGTLASTSRLTRDSLFKMTSMDSAKWSRIMAMSSKAFGKMTFSKNEHTCIL